MITCVIADHPELLWRFAPSPAGYPGTEFDRLWQLAFVNPAPDGSPGDAVVGRQLPIGGPAGAGVFGGRG